MTDCKEVLHHKKLEDSLIMENGCLIFGAWIAGQIEEPGTAAGAPGTFRNAADEAACPLSGMLATQQQ